MSVYPKFSHAQSFYYYCDLTDFTHPPPPKKKINKNSVLYGFAITIFLCKIFGGKLIFSIFQSEI